MSDFVLLSEKPCETLEKLKAIGINKKSNYIQGLEEACLQKTAPQKSLLSSKRTKIIAGISGLLVAIITTLIFINKKK